MHGTVLPAFCALACEPFYPFKKWSIFDAVRGVNFPVCAIFLQLKRRLESSVDKSSKWCQALCPYSAFLFLFFIELILTYCICCTKISSSPMQIMVIHPPHTIPSKFSFSILFPIIMWYSVIYRTGEPNKSVDKDTNNKECVWIAFFEIF